MQHVAVEISESQRARHPGHVTSLAMMPTDLIDGVIIANELLDNLVFRLAVYDGAWREAFVDVDRDGTLVERLSAPFDPLPQQLPGTARLGARVPLIDNARHFVETARHLLRSGSLLTFDYGVTHTADLAARPWRDWLRTYRGQARGEHYLADPGLQDITTDVPMDQLPEPDAVRSQDQFLRLRGIVDLVEEGKRIWAEQASRPGLEAMRMRSRVSEAEALLDPNGLGGFVVAEWRAPTTL